MLHVDARVAPWRMQFSLLKGQDGAKLSAWEEAVTIEDPSAAILASVDKVICSIGALKRAQVSKELTAPPPNKLAQYLLASEQALAVNSAILEHDGDRFLYGERSIVDNLLLLAVDIGTNVRTRCLLLNTLEKA